MRKRRSRSTFPAACSRAKAQRMKAGVSTMCAWLLIVNLETFVRHKQDRHILCRGGAMLHRRTLREPDKMSGPVLTLVGHERSFEYVHAVRAWMRVPRVDGARRI